MSRLVSSAIGALALALSIHGCSNGAKGGGDAGAPSIADAADAADVPSPDAGVPDAQPVCRPGTAWSPGTPAFVERTADLGLELEGNANAFGVVDLDRDGWADLIVIDATANARGKSRVMMNRPHPSGAGRIFADETAASGLFVTRAGDGDGRVASIVTFGDVDGDGDADAFTGIFRDLMQPDTGDVGEVLLNDGAGHFTLAESPPPVGPRDPLTTSAAFTDQDLDGVLDLFVVYWYVQPPFSSAFGQQPQLLRGAGAGAFTDVTDAIGLGLLTTRSSVFAGTNARPLFGGTACDVSGDGRPDLIGAAYGRAWNLLFVSDGDRYVEQGRESGVAGDDRTDVADDQSYRCYCRASAGACPATVLPPARGYPCPGRGWQPGVSDAPAFLNGNTFSIACGDVDNDGDMDLYTGEIRHPDVGSSSDPSELLVNVSEPGRVRFERPGRETMGLSPPIGLNTDEGGQNSALFDFDSDGRLDVYLGGSPYDGNYGWLFHQTDGGRFEWIGRDAGFYHSCPHGLAVADFDHDGDQDVVVGTYGCGSVWGQVQPLRFYENISTQANWISIALEGGGPGAANKSAIGAHVRVTAGGVTQTVEVRSSSGRAGLGTDLLAFVGLGASCTIDAIEVRWPDLDGTTEVHRGVAANQRVLLRQGDPIAHVLP